MSSCRIIAGNWRGRRILFEPVDGLRPTTDRIRETVFNWLQPYLAGGCCLDAFAGSGVLGFEALSRGATELVFVETNKICVRQLQKNITQLNTQQVEIIHQSFAHSLQKDKLSKYKFDVVFLDPPYQANLLSSHSELLNNSGFLAKNAIIYVEHHKKQNPQMPKNWDCLKLKQAGQVVYKLFEVGKTKP